MELRTFLNDDGTAAFSVGEPGNMTSAEIEWHSVEATFKDAAGGVVRRVSATLGGKPEVTGPELAAPVEAHADAGTSKPAEGTGEGFAAFSQAAEHAGEPAAEVKP